MPTIGLICPDEADRQALSLLAGEAGYLVSAAGRIHDAVEILRERRPKAVLVVDSDGERAETFVRELLRVSPLLPVVVALKRRDASRAVSLMRVGAAEVIAPPWTRENVRACLSKTLRFQGTAFSVVRAGKRRSAYFYFFAVLAFFACALGTLSVQHARQTRLAEAAKPPPVWDLPYRHPAALAFDGGSVWVADWYTQSLYRHAMDATLGLQNVIHFPDETPVALAFTPEAVWTVTAAGVVAKRMRDAAFTPVQTWSLPNTAGIAFDGLYLWTYDARFKRLVKRLPDAQLSEIAAYRYPGTQCAALFFDGLTLWSLDGDKRELIKHNLQRPDEALERLPLPGYSAGGYRPVGAGFDGAHFWSVAEKLPAGSGPARLFEHTGLQP